MAETIHTEKPSGVIVRRFSRGEESLLLDVLRDAIGGFADAQRTRAALSSPRFDPDGLLLTWLGGDG